MTQTTRRRSALPIFYPNWPDRPKGGIYALLAVLLWACQPTHIPPGDTLFTRMPEDYTGINFENTLTYTESFNAYTYRNFYNGAGVGMGDLNNDGLIDLYFCGNLTDNKLYLNRGDFRFEDVTEQAGVACHNVWSSGVSIADVNGDGWLDIYVCKSGSPEGENRHNELFINQGLKAGSDVPTFSEQAAAYGIADLGLSTHAAFFDYDRDGDLDCYLLNNSIRPVGGYDLIKNQRQIRDTLGGNKLYRNDGPPEKGGGGFTDVSEQAGIYGSAIGFGLGVTIGDVNRDGWLDIFVSNDFFERDYLYINQQDGTFAEKLELLMPEISLGSMGADMADIDNDGYPEIYVTDMLPQSEARVKTKTTFENWNKYQLNLRNGYHRQFTRNVLHYNNGYVPAIGEVVFSELSRYSGLAATDWSWGALIMDMDNDGLKDIFVANGIYKDLTDQDYINFYSDPQTVRAILSRDHAVITKMIDDIPSEPLPNYAFANVGGLKFENRALQWGLETPTFSNGSAYGDLDNDGDLDLVVNNVNMPSFVYRNEATHRFPERHFLLLELKGEGANPFGLGAQVVVRHEGQTFFEELNPMRGFQSCVDHRLHIGLGNIAQIDSLLVFWPDGRLSVLTSLPTNQLIQIEQARAQLQGSAALATVADPIFEEAHQKRGLDFRHVENAFNDFDRDPLIYHMLSTQGPRLCKADFNGDGLEDVFAGAAKDSPAALYLQGRDGRFVRTSQPAFERDKAGEVTACACLDADGDGDTDLYVGHGGSELPASSSALADKLYLNDGRGRFTPSRQILPAGKFESTACVQPADFDQDGDTDLFVGLRLKPFLYGVPVSGYLLQNDGKGQFTNVTEQLAPGLTDIGMITDAQWLDLEQDGDPDLVVVGEYMPVCLFENEQGQLRRLQLPALEKSNGFWNRVAAADLDQDGDPDLVLANHGLNSRFKASESQPVSMYIGDFDGNGRAEQIVCTYNGDKSYPLVLLHDLVKQLPGLRKKYLKYESYKEQQITDIFGPKQLQKAIRLDAYNMQSGLLINQGNKRFEWKALPAQAQFAPMYAILIQDADADGHADILLGGNFFQAKPEVGIYAGSYGLMLKGDGQLGFEALPIARSGIFWRGAVRDLLPLRVGHERLLLVARNNDSLLVVTNRQKPNM
ncbi:MAG: hypothetical protein D6730_18815 [Bacteroidetes bacterium]|nr:MAG: hypothetical protein D6730_18815 [Bacteroidota bacterium]